MIGFLTAGKNEHYCILSDLSGKEKSIIRPGQYLYVSISNSWIPVELQYSGGMGGCYFAHLPNLPVNGRMAMVKK